MFEILLLIILVGMLVYSLRITGTDKDKLFYLPGVKKDQKVEPKIRIMYGVIAIIAIASIVFLQSLANGGNIWKPLAFFMGMVVVSSFLQLYIFKRR